MASTIGGNALSAPSSFPSAISLASLWIGSSDTMAAVLSALFNEQQGSEKLVQTTQNIATHVNEITHAFISIVLSRLLERKERDDDELCAPKNLIL
mmetsp:Transcript_35663/g.65614  ORF Transcript_35663/g.65614 Transcript_35663/m.65614 type:complete len:96 (-) Transcript_35663:1671-1958(-)